MLLVFEPKRNNPREQRERRRPPPTLLDLTTRGIRLTNRPLTGRRITVFHKRSTNFCHVDFSSKTIKKKRFTLRVPVRSRSILETVICGNKGNSAVLDLSGVKNKRAELRCASSALFFVSNRKRRPASTDSMFGALFTVVS